MSDTDADVTEQPSCPECGSKDTRKQYGSTVSEGYTETFTCGDCPTQFTVYYTYSHKTTDWTEHNTDLDSDR